MLNKILTLNYHNDLIQMLFRAKFGSLSVNLLAPAIIVFIMLPYVPLEILSTWMLAQTIIYLFRVYVSNHGLKILKTQDKKAINKVLYQYLFIIFLNASLFGSAMAFALLYMDSIHTFLIIVIFLTLLTASLSTLTPIYHAVFIFTTFLLIPAMLSLIILGNSFIEQIMLLTLLFYGVISFSYSYKLHKFISDNVFQAQELKKREQQLFDQSRLAQMGELISMIAHQWRQPLSVISSTALNLQVKIELGKRADEEYTLEKLKSISNVVQDLTHIIDDFRNFYKPDKAQVSIRLDNLFNKTLAIINSSLSSDNITVSLSSTVTKEISVYDGELMQVILNLLRNAQDNFNDNNITNRQITVHITDYVLTVSDNGGGIDEEIINKVFDPYFSTKDEKNGTGLGLYMSKMIVNDHHKGILSFKNIDDGACFIIDLSKKL